MIQIKAISLLWKKIPAIPQTAALKLIVVYTIIYGVVTVMLL